MDKPMLDDVGLWVQSFLSPTVLVELAALAGCVALAWGLVSLLQRGLHRGDPRSILFGTRIVDGALFPLALLSLAYVARTVLLQWVALAVFKVAVPVLVALVVIRIGVKVLQVAYPNAAWVRPIERSISWMAWLCMVLACLSDEVTIAMAPLPVAYAFLIHREYRTPRKLALRALAYGAIVAALLPLQFLFTPDDEPRLALYGIGWHMPDQALSLAGQLVLPIADPNPMDVPEILMSDTQVAAGMVLVAVVGLCLLVGSGRVRFLALWVIAAITPFTLWNADVVAPRYVYLAAAPFAVLAAVLGSAMIERVKFQPVRLGFAGAGAVALIVAAVFGTTQTQARDGKWEAATNDYRVLAHGIQSLDRDVASGARVVILDGPWYPYWFWPVATVRTIYQDETLWAVSVPPGWPFERLPGDVILYHADGRLYLTQVNR